MLLVIEMRFCLLSKRFGVLPRASLKFCLSKEKAPRFPGAASQQAQECTFRLRRMSTQTTQGYTGIFLLPQTRSQPQFDRSFKNVWTTPATGDVPGLACVAVGSGRGDCCLRPD